MKKRRKWIWVVIILLVVIAGVSLLLNQNQVVRYAEDIAVTGDLSTYYNFSGSVEVTNAVTVLAPSDTTVADVYVSSNQQVAKSARLLRLEDGTLLKADLAGEVTGLNVETGSVIRSGDELLELMDLSSMKATFQVDEYDVAAVEIGKMVNITVDGTGASFTAPITALDKRAVQSGDLSYYTATVDLQGIELPAGTLPGMQISVDVLHQETKNAVLLRIGAVSFGADNTPYVLMQAGQEMTVVPVTVGINEGVYVEILTGVKSGDTVLYIPSSTTDLQALMTRRSERLTSGVE